MAYGAIAVMGAQGAVNILYRKELADDDGDDARQAGHRVKMELANPYLAAERGCVDAVINPHETRVEITRVLRLLRTKRQTYLQRSTATSRYEQCR